MKEENYSQKVYYQGVSDRVVSCYLYYNSLMLRRENERK